jgi:hypothetical protein
MVGCFRVEHFCEHNGIGFSIMNQPPPAVAAKFVAGWRSVVIPFADNFAAPEEFTATKANPDSHVRPTAFF